MKPIELSLRNFGPFANEMVDFENLDAMFLVRGNTGSGKTTIFDAISYALYGKYTGARQTLPKKALRSHFVPESEESSVSFTFSVGDAVFRIVRTLPSTYTNRNGKESTRDAIVTLESKKNGEWILFPGKNSEIDARIEKSIIKLPFDEFSKIVVLPQGEFAKFLRQSSSERGETLKKIFPVEKITKTVELIASQAKTLRENLSAIERRMADFHSEESIDSLRTRSGELKSSIISLNSELSALVQRTQKQAEEQNEIKNRIREAQKAQAVKAELESLRKNAKSIEEKFLRLEKAKKAQEFSPLLSETESRGKQLADITRSAINAQKAAQKAADDFSFLEEKHDEMATLEEKTKSDEKTLGELKRKLNVIEEIQSARAKKARAEESLAKAAVEMEEKRGEIAVLEKAISEKAVPILGSDFSAQDHEDSIQGIVQALFEHAHKKADEEKAAEKLVETAGEYEKARLDTENARAKHDALKEKMDTAEKNLSATKKILSELEESERVFEAHHRAAVVARTLQEGLPCPVCGSCVHPAPAKDDSVSLADKIAAQKENCRFAEEAAKKSRDDYAHVQAVLAEKEARLKDLSCVEAKSAGQELEKARESYKSAAAALEEAKQNAEKIARKKNALSFKQEEISRLSADVARLSGSVAEQEKQIAEGDSAQSLKEEIMSLSATFGRESRMVEEYKKDVAEAETTLTAAKSRKKQLEETKAGMEEAFKNISGQLEEKISKSEFKTREAVISFMLPLPEQNTLQRDIEDWNTEVKSKTEFLAHIQADDRIEELEARARDLENDIFGGNTKIGELQGKTQEESGVLATIESKIREYEALESERKKIVGESETLLRLAADVTGDNPKNIQFADWVLAMHFSEVVDYANVRLHELSGGRYQFTIEKTTNRGNHGLDIAINDASTGQNRNPATLSGGETFQASISLALAMTDVVESHSGGIKLESLFIDEGFGTLDSDALRTAISILKKIELSNKKVGIISHVEQLQNEIPSQISVERGRISIV